MVKLVDWARSNVWVSFGFYCLYVVCVMALPITPFPIMGGVLFPFWLAFPLNVLAATTGAWFSYGITRFFGREAVESFLKEKIKTWDQLTTTQGFKTVVVLRLVGIPPFIIANYALGFSGVNHSDFLLGTMVGILPWMGLVTYLAHSLWEAALTGGQRGLTKALFEALRPFMILSATIVIFLLVNAFLKRRRHSNL